jgi:hypothetical protein
MNKWITRQFIAFSELTGRPVPRFVRKLVSPATLDRELRKEQRLTEALQVKDPSTETIPPSLVEELDAALRQDRTKAETPSDSNKIVFPIWATSLAAVLVLSLTIFLVMPDRDTAENEELINAAPVESHSSPARVDSSHKIPSLLFQSIEQDLVFQPIKREQDRLADDVTNAIQYMADSFLPESYAVRVNENLRTLKKEISSSI